MKYKFPQNIGVFKKYDKKPQAISGGALYETEINLSVPFEKPRKIRVYLPDDYDGEKAHPVIYMCDGQNCVDRYLSAYGEWDIDEHDNELIKLGLPSLIVVGIDCPKDPLHRMMEYIIEDHTFKKMKKSKDPLGQAYLDNHCHAYGELLVNDIIKRIKPLIDKTFSTLADQENTAFGGASMGGLFAFDIVRKYPKVFSFALTFSPAFFLFDKDFYYNSVEMCEMKQQYSKYFLYSGGRNLEEEIVGPTKRVYKILKNKKNFDEEHLIIKLDSRRSHNEKAWSAHFLEAIKFWYGVEEEEKKSILDRLPIKRKAKSK